MNTIRRNTRWFHVTECPQPHYFHYDCWAEYRRAEQASTGQRGFLRLRCPTCRHVQISFADMTLAVDLMLGRRCALCLREEPFAPMTVECGRSFCERCLVQHVRSKADSGVDATCPVCGRTVVNEIALLRYVFVARGAPPDHQLPPCLASRYWAASAAASCRALSCWPSARTRPHTSCWRRSREATSASFRYWTR